MQHPDIASPARTVDLRGFARRAADATEHSFYAKKILIRHSLGQGAKERAVPAAKIDMQWRTAPKDFWKIEMGDVRFRDQFDHGKELCLRRSNATSPAGRPSRTGAFGVERTKRWR